MNTKNIDSIKDIALRYLKEKYDQDKLTADQAADYGAYMFQIGMEVQRLFEQDKK